MYFKLRLRYHATGLQMAIARSLLSEPANHIGEVSEASTNCEAAT